MPVILDNVKLDIDEVKTVMISDIGEYPASGGYSRLISIYTETSSDRRPRLELLLTSMDRATLEIVTPPQLF